MPPDLRQDGVHIYVVVPVISALPVHIDPDRVLGNVVRRVDKQVLALKNMYLSGPWICVATLHHKGWPAVDPHPVVAGDGGNIRDDVLASLNKPLPGQAS